MRAGWRCCKVGWCRVCSRAAGGVREGEDEGASAGWAVGLCFEQRCVRRRRRRTNAASASHRLDLLARPALRVQALQKSGATPAWLCTRRPGAAIQGTTRLATTRRWSKNDALTSAAPTDRAAACVCAGNHKNATLCRVVMQYSAIATGGCATQQTRVRGVHGMHAARHNCHCPHVHTRATAARSHTHTQRRRHRARAWMGASGR